MGTLGIRLIWPVAHSDGGVGTSMSAHPIPKENPGFGCSPIKVVRELGSERCETVRPPSAVGVGDLNGLRSTRTGNDAPGVRLFCTRAPAYTDQISAESI